MADSKITDLTALTGANVADDDLVPIVDFGADETKKITAAQLSTYMGTKIGPKGHYVTGEYIVPPMSASVSNFAFNNDQIYLTPILILSDVTVDRLAISTSVISGAGGVARLGLYSSTSAGIPSTLLTEGTVAVDSGTGTKLVTISQSLTAGLYWTAFACQGSPSPSVTVAYGTYTPNALFYVSNSGVTGSGNPLYTKTGITGAFPNPISSMTRQNNGPIVSLRVA